MKNLIRNFTSRFRVRNSLNVILHSQVHEGLLTPMSRSLSVANLKDFEKKLPKTFTQPGQYIVRPDPIPLAIGKYPFCHRIV